MNKNQSLIFETVNTIFKYIDNDITIIDFYKIEPYIDKGQNNLVLNFFKHTKYEEKINKVIEECTSIEAYEIKLKKNSIELYLKTHEWQGNPYLHHYSLNFNEIDIDFYDFLFKELYKYINKHTIEFYDFQKEKEKKEAAIIFRKNNFPL